MARSLTPPEERFVAFVNETPHCWEWTGAISPNGYGAFGDETGKTVSTHRWIWEYTMGPIPKGKHICHTCDNPSCVRPEHLYVGTVQTNIEDKIRRGRLGRCGGRGVTKLKKHEQDHICMQYKKGMSVKELAVKHGVHYNTIYRYLKGETSE